MAQYEGKPRHPVPSRQYAIFIDVFEKRVAEHQAAINKLRGVEHAYNVVTEALKNSRWSGDFSLEASELGIKITAHLGTNDYLDDFASDIVDRIGSALLSGGLHEDGLPSVADSNIYLSRRWTYQIKAKDILTVSIVAYIDDKTGTRDYRVTSMDRTVTITDHYLERRGV